MKAIVEYLLSKNRNKTLKLFRLDMSYEEAVDVFDGYDKKVFNRIIGFYDGYPKENELLCLENGADKTYRNMIRFRLNEIIYTFAFKETNGIMYINKYVFKSDWKTNNVSFTATDDAKDVMQELLDELNNNFEL